MSRGWMVAVGAAASAALLIGMLLFRSSPNDVATGEATDPPVDVSASASTTVPAHGDDDLSTAAVGDDESGAVVAAIELSTAPQDWLYLSDEDLETEVRAVAARASSDRLVEKITAEVRLARDALARSPGRVWWVVRPLAWRVDTFSTGRAQVSVWTVSVLSAADVAMPQSDWTTTVLDLEWDGDRWRLVSTLDTPGPTPQVGGRDEVWEPEPFDEALNGFVRVGSEVPS